MNKDNKFEELLVSLQKEDLDIIDKLKEMVAFIRPSHLNNIENSLEGIDTIIRFFNEKSQLSQDISNELNILFIDSKISVNITKH